MSNKVTLPMLLGACASLAAAQPNADPAYRALRDAAPSETYRVENIELKRDVGTLHAPHRTNHLPRSRAEPVSMAVFTARAGSI